MNKTIILGAGISGLGAVYACKQKGIQPLILERMILLADCVDVLLLMGLPLIALFIFPLPRKRKY